jgi:serine/threonine protein kinase
MADVYLARDTRLGREVAIKVLATRLADDPGLRERLEREAQAASSLNHPGICTIYDVGEHDGHPYIVMERLEGAPLDERLRSGPLDVEQVLRLGIEVTDALTAAHAKGIVHRDIKPANVFLTEDGRIKLLDFGIAKVAAPDEVDREAPTLGASKATTPGTTLGTYAYMSPEQARGDEVDERTDIFSLGVLLYEASTGACPFARETAGRTLEAVLTDEPQRADSLRPDVPADLARVLERALEKDRGLRYQHCADLRVELVRVQRGSDPEARVTTQPPSRRGPVLGLAAGVALAVALAAIFLPRSPAPVGPDEWEQLTFFTDSVTSPALSPDGRMLTYLRGDSTFIGSADVYVQMPPGGEPTRLTHDGTAKLDPQFSPDGSRIAYSYGVYSVNLVPVLGGPSQEILQNASAMTWVGDNRVMFSEIREGLHMGVITSTLSRGDVREVYYPESELGMAHRSYLSPDGESVLLAEMATGWLPCRVVPFDGSSDGIRVGPENAACTSGAWSGDGRYVYLTVETEGQNHIWRQRYPGGEPEQLTFGPTEQEGIAMDPDGDSFITAVGTVSWAVWVDQGEGERQISEQGDGMTPLLSADGRSLYYLERRSGSLGEMIRIDLPTGKRERLLQGFSLPTSGVNLTGYRLYDISADGSRVVFVAQSAEGALELWVTRLDGRGSPTRLPASSPDVARFGPDGWVYYQDVGDGSFLYRVRDDGTGRERVLEVPLIGFGGLSPNGDWAIVRLADSAGKERSAMDGSVIQTTSIWAQKLDGSEAPIQVCTFCIWADWGPGGDYLHLQTAGGGDFLAVPIPPGAVLPRFPPDGLPADDFPTWGDALVPGGEILFGVSFAPGASPSNYAIARQTVHRNLYRIPLR